MGGARPGARLHCHRCTAAAGAPHLRDDAEHGAGQLHKHGGEGAPEAVLHDGGARGGGQHQRHQVVDERVQLGRVQVGVVHLGGGWCGVWCVVRGVWCGGAWCVVRGVWCCGVWCVVCGVVVRGVWCVVWWAVGSGRLAVGGWQWAVGSGRCRHRRLHAGVCQGRPAAAHRAAAAAAAAMAAHGRRGAVRCGAVRCAAQQGSGGVQRPAALSLGPVPHLDDARVEVERQRGGGGWRGVGGRQAGVDALGVEVAARARGAAAGGGGGGVRRQAGRRRGRAPGAGWHPGAGLTRA